MPSLEDDSSGGIYPVGSTVFKHYKILGVIASGGKGRVYEAQDQNLDSVVALKVLLRSASEDRDVLRFQNEARLASKLKHPNIAVVYNFGVEEGVPYLTQEFVKGKTLQQILDSETTLSLDRFFEVFKQIASAMNHAHKNGIVHRDLKPANLMLTDQPDDQCLVKILDFGIAKNVQDDTEEKQMLTSPGSIVGTPFYISPEQSRATDATPKADSYSLGCVMWHSLTGGPPFAADSFMETLILHQTADPQELATPPGTPDSLEAFVKTLLAKDPASRPDMNKIHSELARIENDLVEEMAALEAAASKDVDTVSGGTPSHTKQLLIAAAVLLVIAVPAVIFVLSQPKQSTPAQPARMFSRDKKYSPTAVEQVEQNVVEKNYLSGDTLYTSGADAAKHLTQHQGDDRIKVVNLCGYEKLGPEVFTILAEFPSLQQLTLYKMKVNDLSQINKLKHLTELELVECTIGDTVLSDVGKSTKISRLGLQQSTVTNDQLRQLAGNQSIGYLELSRCENIDFSDISWLKKMKHVERIFLTGTNITDDQLMKLSSYPPLKSIDMAKCKNVKESWIHFRSRVPHISYNDHPSYLTTINEQLAALSKDSESDEDARKILKMTETAIKHVRESGHANENHLVSLYIHAGSAAAKLKQWQLGAKYCLQADTAAAKLEGFRKERIIALNHLSDCLHNLGQHEQAYQTQKRLMPLIAAEFGNTSMPYISNLRVLGIRQADNKDYASAIETCRRLMPLYQKVGNPTEVQAVRIELGRNLTMSGKSVESSGEIVSAMAALKKLPKSNERDSNIITAHTLLAANALNSANYKDALKENAEALKLVDQNHSFEPARQQLLKQRDDILIIQKRR